jgi:RNA polymerase sigma factor (sigma-70 family)
MRSHRLGPSALRRLLKLANPSPAIPITDRELLKRFLLDGSEEAFAELVNRHGPMVLAACRRQLRDRHAAEDAFQATFLVLARKAGQVRWRESIGGWLFEVATRVARKAAGQAARRNAREGAPAGFAPEPVAPTPAPASDLTALRVALDEELQRLPDRFRTPLVLCHLEGLSQDEVARHLGITGGQLRGRLYRARERLRERLLRRGFTLSAVLLALAVGREAHAVPAVLAAGTLRLVTAAPNVTPVGVRLLAQGVIRDMTTTTKKLAVLTVFGILGLAAAGFAVRAALADSTQPIPPPVVAGGTAQPPAEPAGPQPEQNPRPEIVDKQGGFVHSVDGARTKLFVDFDLAAGKGEDADITPATRVLFGGKAIPLGDLKPGMRVKLVYYKGSNAPNEVRASWPRLRPRVKAVDAVKRTVVFEFVGQQGVALDVALPVAADAAVTLDGLPVGLADVPPGEASWLTLSADKKSLIGITAFSPAYDVSGTVANVDPATRELTVNAGAGGWVKLPVAAAAKVILDGEDATLADAGKYKPVLIRCSAGRKAIVGIVAVSERYDLPLPRPAGK